MRGLAETGFKYSSAQFGAWRIAFGAYLFVYLVKTLPFTTEIFQDGSAPNSCISLAPDFEGQWITAFPKMLLFLSPLQIKAVFVASIFLAFLLMIGLYRRLAALGLWFLAAWMQNCGGSAITTPESEFVHWLLAACVLIPSGERFSVGTRNPDWAMPKPLYWGAWLVLGVAYFYAGAWKIGGMDPSWVDGTYIYHMLSTNVFRFTWYGDFFDHVPMSLLKLWSWSALFFETFAILFMPFRKARAIWWTLATANLLLWVFLWSITQVFLGMLLFHLFLLDPGWLKQRATAGRT